MVLQQVRNQERNPRNRKLVRMFLPSWREVLPLLAAVEKPIHLPAVYTEEISIRSVPQKVVLLYV